MDLKDCVQLKKLS